MGLVYPMNMEFIEQFIKFEMCAVYFERKTKICNDALSM